MRLLVVLGLLAAAMSAPVKELMPENVIELTEGGMDHSVAKRTDEKIIFGNQQNAPRVKKADPEVDPKGVVRALPADAVPMDGAIMDIPKEVPEQSVESSETGDSATKDNVLDMISESKGETPQQAAEEVKNEETIGSFPVIDIAEPKETDLKSDELSKSNTAGEERMEAAGDEAMSEEGSGSVEDDYNDKMTFDDLEKIYNEAEVRPPKYEYYYPEYYSNYRKKRNTDDGNIEVKRSHRTKRALGYDDFIDYFPSTLNDDPYYDVYRKRQMEDDLNESVARQLAPLLTGYGKYAREYPERYDNPEYLEYLADNSDELDDGFPYEDNWETEDEWGTLNRPADNPYRTLFRSQPTSFLPVKRQMLSMVPGSRRKRFNYPYAMEPNGHWGAFVENTQKRENEAAYERLYRLARALATKRSPYGAYWEDFDEEYKKK